MPQEGIIFRNMDPLEAAYEVIDSAGTMYWLDTNGTFAQGTIIRIEEAIKERRDNEFDTDPTQQPEVAGLARAALREYAHMYDDPTFKHTLERYIVGALQTDDDSLDTALEELLGRKEK